jgi:AraC-like DNA-binding protein
LLDGQDYGAPRRGGMIAPPNLLTDAPRGFEMVGMDALSDVLRFVGLTGGVFIDAEFTAPWAVSGKVAPELCRPYMVQPEYVVGFHYVVEGALVLTLGDGVARRIAAGELVMLPRNDLHVFGSAESRAECGVGALMRKPGASGVARIVHGGGGARTRMVCGFLGGDVQLHPLLANLPSVMTLALATLPSGDWMERTFAYAAQTLADGDPGAATVMAKMSELLFVEAVRRYLAALPPEETGWLAGLRDPAIGRALSLMHARLNENWTADALAREVNMSRSTFADRFTALVGVPPMRYLLNWRMLVAKHKLQETRRTIVQIAFEVGYESEAAFTRAFRREFGQPPATWRKTASTQ